MITGIEPEVEVVTEEAPAKPKLEVAQADGSYGKFIIEPLERGFGHTLGNALRRVLLGSLPGAAITAVQIDGVQHEYSTMKGVREDVAEILLNLKGVRLRVHTQRSGTLQLKVKGPGQVTAGDIQPSADYEVVNPELYLATLDSGEARLSMQLHVGVGPGYKSASSTEGMPIGYLPLDAIFTPTRKVNYTVDKTRVGQVTDYERLTLEVWTDGSKEPVDAMREAARILVDAFGQFATLGLEQLGRVDGQRLAALVPAEIYTMPIEKLELSARTLNCLKRSKINKVGEILEMSQDDLLKIKNFGEKSLEELNARLEAMKIKRPELPPEGAPVEGLTKETKRQPAAKVEVAEEVPAPAAGAKKEREKPGRAKETFKDLAALRAIFTGGEEGKTEGEPNAGGGEKKS